MLHKIVIAGKYALLCGSKLQSFHAFIARGTPSFEFRIPTPAILREIAKKHNWPLQRWYDESGVITDFSLFTTDVRINAGAMCVRAVTFHGKEYYADAFDTAYHCGIYYAELQSLRGDYTIV